jgi:hypothetical protein
MTFTVPGVAAPQGSKRAFRTKSGRIALVESSAKLKPYRSSVALAAVAAGTKVCDGPIRMVVTFTFERPKSHYVASGSLRSTAPDYPAKPDLDKLCRAVGDALTGVVYHDDSQIVEWSARKCYADTSCTVISVIFP